jgi:hypothetical protein
MNDKRPKELTGTTDDATLLEFFYTTHFNSKSS